MTLFAYRSQRVEDLVGALASALKASWPADPFEPVPILVGSRGMDRWLRHELATRLGAIARVDFLFPRAAFDGAARWLLDGPSADDRAPFWQLSASQADEWSGPRLVARVVRCLRAQGRDDARFARVRRYLGDVGDAVHARELAFAEEVASTVERVLYDRSDDALRWTDDPGAAPAEHAWLAALLAALEAGVPESPARVRKQVSALVPVGAKRALHVFGLTTLRPGDKRWLATLARHLDVHLFAFAPSSVWWEDIRKRSEQVRALREARSEADVVALLGELERQNALLAANGDPSRDLQVWLEGLDETVRDGEGGGHPEAGAPTTLLGHLQAWVDGAEESPRAAVEKAAPWSALARCGSLEVHACHGALRQCEALRDELLRRFAADPTLEPRHVLVMTPDVATHAPLLAAVLSRQGGGPAIPLHVADLGIRAQNPVADALVRILALADERVTASRLLDVLSVGPVRLRFGLSEDDVAAVRGLVVGSGMRWAWDAADRARHDQPALDQNTVRFGLERLALGVLMHDPGGLGVVPARGGLPPAVPFEVAGRDAVERFGRLAAACDALRGVRERVREAADAASWRERLRELVADFTSVEAEAAWQRAEVEGALADLLPDDGGAGVPFDRSAIAALLEGAFERSIGGDRPITGAVTVCALEPMRSVPFRVIAILGLDDGAFPRPGRTPAWDPFAERRGGEYDRRTIDRHLFLEAVLCARDALLLFGTGFEPARGQPAPMSVVVSELCEVVGAGVGEAPEKLRVEHPLQPWSEASFGVRKGKGEDERARQPARLPFDTAWKRAAERLRGARAEAGLAATRLDAEWPAEENPARTITADELARALARPQEELLKRRLGLALEADDAEVPDREPLEHGTLEGWALRARVLGAWDDEAEPDVDAIEARLRGEGALQLRAGGRRALEDVVEAVRSARERAASIATTRAEPLQASAEVEGVRVTAVAADVRSGPGGRCLVWVTASKRPNARAELGAWITLLVAVAAGEPVASASVCAVDEARTLLPPPDAASATELLAALVRTRAELRCAPVRLFPRLSREVARGLAASPPKSAREAVEAAGAAWNGTPLAPGDRDDVWVSALFGHLDLDALAARADELAPRAMAVWAPLLAAAAGSKGSKGKGAKS